MLVWDHASWHTSATVHHGIRTHNHRVKTQRRGVRIVSGLLPRKSPWLNPIAPTWVHGQRAVVEPERVVSAAELEARVYAYDACEPELHLTISEQAA